MPAFVALLRAVNLPNHNTVSMADLRSMAEAAGFRGARTLLQSGNLVFEAGRDVAADLEAVLEREAATRLGLVTDFIVRSSEELQAIVAGNPFPDAAREDPGHLVVNFMKQPPSPAGVDALRATIKGPEAIEARGRELYIVYPDGIGRSKLTAALIDRHLQSRGTGRNWNTVLKLAEMTSA